MNARRIVLSLLGLVVVAGACGEAGDGEVAAGDASTTTVLSEPSPRASEGEWRPMAQPPASVAPGAPAVWTGSEIVVWGGGFGPDRYEAGGGSYDPDTDTWTELPPAPEDAPDGGTAVWTGEEVIFWGGAEITTRQVDAQRPVVASGAAYDPVGRSWRRLAESPLSARAFHEAVWTGTEMIVWGGMAGVPTHGPIHDPTAAAYDPQTDTWRELADVPRPWSGDGGSTVTRAFAGDMFVWRDDDLARYSVEDDRWQSLGGGPPRDPDAPVDVSSVGPTSVGVVVGETFYVWTGGTRAVNGAALPLPTGGGKAIADAPHFTDFTPRLVAAADAIFAVNYDYGTYQPGDGTSVWRYDLEADSWERLPNPPAEVGAGATPVWTGEALVVLPSQYGDDRQRGTGAIWSKR